MLGLGLGWLEKLRSSSPSRHRSLLCSQQSTSNSSPASRQRPFFLAADYSRCSRSSSDLLSSDDTFLLRIITASTFVQKPTQCEILFQRFFSCHVSHGCSPYNNNTSKTDVAPWCYKWVVNMDGWCPGGVRYRTPYSAKKFSSGKTDLGKYYAAAHPSTVAA